MPNEFNIVPAHIKNSFFFWNYPQVMNKLFMHLILFIFHPNVSRDSALKRFCYNQTSLTETNGIFWCMGQQVAYILRLFQLLLIIFPVNYSLNNTRLRAI